MLLLCLCASPLLCPDSHGSGWYPVGSDSSGNPTDPWGSPALSGSLAQKPSRGLSWGGPRCFPGRWPPPTSPPPCRAGSSLEVGLETQPRREAFRTHARPEKQTNK